MIFMKMIMLLIETISKEKYDELMIGTKQITSIDVNEDDFDILDCESGACPIK